MRAYNSLCPVAIPEISVLASKHKNTIFCKKAVYYYLNIQNEIINITAVYRHWMSQVSLYRHNTGYRATSNPIDIPNDVFTTYFFMQKINNYCSFNTEYRTKHQK